MTKDEILNMTAGSSLDALISEKIFGRPFIKPGHGSCCTCQVCGHDYDNCCCGYSDEIGMAWKVVEEMGDCLHLKQHGSEGNWAAMFCGANDDFVNAETAPEAICKAALLAWRQNERL